MVEIESNLLHDIATHIARAEGDISWMLNNIHTKISPGISVSQLERNLDDPVLRSRLTQMQCGIWRVRVMEQAQLDVLIGHKFPEDIIEHSDQYRNQTPREFLGVIDEASAILLPADETADIKGMDVCFRIEKLLPVYIELRKRGYSHWDITR